MPLYPEGFLSDLPETLGLDVILVVGTTLGCLNHALLTQEAILRRGLRLAGWVANRLDPEMAAYSENLDTLRYRLGVPPIAEIPYLGNFDPMHVMGYIANVRLLALLSGAGWQDKRVD